MPRNPRLYVPGVPLRIVQRGNNRQAVLFQEQDYSAWLGTLFESAIRYEASVHAWVCMTNQVHLLATPWGEVAASRIMQRLGTTYTAGLNVNYRRSGSLWEGRFKSSLVDCERYLLACYRYKTPRPADRRPRIPVSGLGARCQPRPPAGGFCGLPHHHRTAGRTQDPPLYSVPPLEEAPHNPLLARPAGFSLHAAPMSWMQRLKRLFAMPQGTRS